MLTSIFFSAAVIHIALVKGFSPLEYHEVRESTFCMVTMPERGSFVLALGFRCFSHAWFLGPVVFGGITRGRSMAQEAYSSCGMQNRKTNILISRETQSSNLLVAFPPPPKSITV